MAAAVGAVCCGDHGMQACRQVGRLYRQTLQLGSRIGAAECRLCLNGLLCLQCLLLMPCCRLCMCWVVLRQRHCILLLLKLGDTHCIIAALQRLACAGQVVWDVRVNQDTTYRLVPGSAVM